MEINILKPRKALNKAFLKVKTRREEIEKFKTNLAQLIDRINDSESEEFHKNLVSDFLKRTYYEPNHFINTKGRNDLVIHNSNSASGTVGVIIEAKKPTNKAEMLTTEKLNVKAFQELVLYYLRERVTQKNIEIKYLIATNINEWFIFDATLFDRLFAQNKNFVNRFIDFENARLSDTKTDFFYKQIAEPFIAEIKSQIEFTFFDIRDYEKALRNTDKKDDNQLIALYKLLSPEHLLKLPFANDSNSLDKRFYGELLHIIGLTETKDGSKKLIQRNKEGERNTGSLLENAIIQLDTLDKISRLENPGRFGVNLQERLFNVALELSITWINRILFLKLLEAQLVSYHKGDHSFEFLNLGKIKDYDELNSLFFQVLARRQNERSEDVKILFAKVPYLNSSLFEPTDIEHSTVFISNLRNDKTLPIYSSTVLKDGNGKKRSGNINPLQYLFEFLDAYDFASEGKEGIQEENKSLINASVLGLIFEKINGYKDGSFFTPGFITMYMCRETIRKAIVQKFNEVKGWNCTDICELRSNIEDRVEANRIINDLKICDPAVGSGHFLVSALNEIIAIKSDLGILLDIEGHQLRDIQIEVINDELQIVDIETDELFFYLAPAPRHEKIVKYSLDGDSFTYKSEKIPFRQVVQQSIFSEKRYLIENCLFGVDINPNSVKICRLRLWIELLKSAFYTPESNYVELETLPNIDINIKCGNSLISRYPLDANLKTALKTAKISIESYRTAIATYRSTSDKNVKREMEKLILKIKQDFTSEIRSNDPIKTRLDKLANELYNRFTGNFLFEPIQPYGKKGKELEKKRKKEQEKLEKEINELSQKIEEIKNNIIYENSFEWRFEFPEVLDNNGDFVGFDVIIGNPPYKMIQPNNTSVQEINYMRNSYPFADFKIDLFHLFFQLGGYLGKNSSYLSFIAPSSLLNNVYANDLRNYINEHFKIHKIAVSQEKIFDDAEVHTAIYFLQKDQTKEKSNLVYSTTNLRAIIFNNETFNYLIQNEFNKITNNVWNLMLNNENVSIFKKISTLNTLSKYANINRGLITGDRTKYFSKTKETEFHELILTGSDILRYSFNFPSEYVLFKRPTTSGGCWDKEVHFSSFKICIRQIGTRPTATLIEEQFAVTGNIFTVINSDKDLLKLYLAIINSNFIRYYWKIMFADFKSTFPQVTIKSLSQIPIPKFDTSQKVQLVKLTDEILQQKKQFQGSDTTALEAQIDQLVYKLYDLTEEEIAIVENGVK